MEYLQFTVVGKIEEVETIARGKGIRVLERLNKSFGRANWRKLKGLAQVRFPDGFSCRAEIHWYEAHGVGKVKMKIKRFLS